MAKGRMANMESYRVLIGKREYKVEIAGNQLFVNGKKEQVNLVPLNDGGMYVLRRGGQSHELHVHPNGSRTYEVTANGRRVVARVERGRGLPRRQNETHDEGQLVAPMPGLVVGVRVKEGDQVDQGQVLVVLESMKMQMELRAPVAGRVTHIAAQPKSQVDKGDFLAQVS